MKRFDLETSIKKWCEENNHDGFYCASPSSDACGCLSSDLAPCGCMESIIDGDCVGGKLIIGDIRDSDGNKCTWGIFPHDTTKI